MDKTETHQELAEEGLAGLERSQQFAWKRALETGTPFIIWKDGKAVDLNPATNGGQTYAEAAKPETSLVREDKPAED